MCRKIAETPNGGTIDIWGDGKQTRSFLYVVGVRRGHDPADALRFEGPVNIGSEEMVTINQLADMIMRSPESGWRSGTFPGPLGVRGRNSDNRLIEEKLGWKPSQPLSDGLAEDLRVDRAAGDVEQRFGQAPEGRRQRGLIEFRHGALAAPRRPADRGSPSRPPPGVMSRRRSRRVGRRRTPARRPSPKFPGAN